MSKLTDATTSYKTAKAIQDGIKLWCMWAKTDPLPHAYGQNKTGFVVNTPADMRKMAADLFRLADELEAYSKMWEDDA